MIDLILTLNNIDIAALVNSLERNARTTTVMKTPKLRVTWIMVLNENKRNMILSSLIYRGKKQIFKRNLTKYDVLDILLKFWTLGLTFVNIFLLNAEKLFEASSGKQRQICMPITEFWKLPTHPPKQTKIKTLMGKI